MRIEIDKEEYKDLIETKEEFLKTVRKLDNITIENIKLTDKLQEKEQECEELKQTLTEIKEIAEECYYKCNSMNNCNISCKYYNNCNGEFSYLLACLNKQISECEVENDNK